jgi:hypothetical protein
MVGGACTSITRSSHGGGTADLKAQPTGLSNCAMQKKYSLGPRGWAVFTLVGGVTLAVPFLRQPRVGVEGFEIQSPMSPASGLGPFAASEPTARNTANNGSAFGSSAFGDAAVVDSADFSQQIVPPAGTSPTALPAWAPTHSPIDQLISRGTAPPWQSDTARVSTIKPLEPWTDAAGTSQPQQALPSTLARAWPDGSSLPIADNAPALGRTPGSLAGTAQHARPTATPRLRPPANPTPSEPQYVYQPGFHGAAK